MENKTNGLVYILQMDRQSMPIPLVWDSCLGPEMLLVLLPGLHRCRKHKVLLTDRDTGTLGENIMTCVKKTFKMLQESRQQQYRTSSRMYLRRENSGAFDRFRYLEKVRCRGHPMCSTFQLQHTEVESYAPNTQRNTCTTMYETFVYNTMKIRSWYLELLCVNRHGKGNRRIL